MNTRSKNQITAMRAAQRKRPTRIISLILSLSLISGNLTGFFSAAAELNHFCGKEAHTHTEECYRVYNTPDPTVTEETVVVEETVLETVPNETAESVEATTETVVETTAEAVVETTGEAVPEPAYTISETPVCGKEEHTHVVQCYSDPSADVETAEQWEANLPENPSGIWSEDLLATVSSQLGYQESASNYIVEEDESLSGYNRYGAWYSSFTQDANQAYLPWNITFLFFSIYYSQITDLPLEETCPEWIDSLAYYELYRAAGEYTPNPGDMVFVDTDGDGEADRAGIVSEVEDETLTAIEGDYEGTVAEVTYTIAVVTEETETEETTAAAEEGETAESTETETGEELDVSVGQSSIMLLSADSEEEEAEPNVLGYADMTQAQADAQPENGDVSVMASLDAGYDYFYLDITNANWWDDDDVEIRLWYWCDNSNGKYSDKFTQYSDNIYWLKVPSDMQVSNNAKFILKRFESGKVSTGSTTWSEGFYNRVNGDITVSTDKNTYTLNTVSGDAKDATTGYWSGWTGDDYSSGSGSSGEETDTLPELKDGNQRVFYDATLSKLSYNGDSGTATIPVANGNSEGSVIYCHYWDGVQDGSILMKRLNNYTSGANTWSDTYYADIPSAAKKVLFYSSNSISEYPNNSSQTVDLDIPDNITNPCFYGDSSDDVIYNSSAKRSGYWGEAFMVRNPGTVVDIPKEKRENAAATLYLNTTFYDYYTDFELNGNNRDNYSTGASKTTHRIYQPFRHFNQALSSYYSGINASNPLYWGNFQNYNTDENSDHFDEIADTLNLYGYSNNKNKFFAENNSMWGYDGNELTDSAQATMGLVSNELTNGNLMIKTSGGSAIAPYFSKSFLEGGNSKNTVLGKVYENVSFPFTKEALESSSDQDATGTVDYWVFDSRDTTLRLKEDSTDGYWLDSTDVSAVYGSTPDKEATSDENFFPFNDENQSKKSQQLNYGFATKLELKFRLTENGTVKTTDNKDVPIEFNFSGDDDVWVFIDGKLALDVGGGHGRVAGYLNFRDKTYHVDRVKGSSSGVESNEEGSFEMSGANTDEHTLTMFYMERGLWESNMQITFNFPDENQLEVEKNVDDSKVNALFNGVFDNQKMFTFNIKNLATHFADVAAKGETHDAIAWNVAGSTLRKDPSNTFDRGTYCNKEYALHWKAQYDDTSSVYRHKRYGVLSLDTPINISDMTKLSFNIYVEDNSGFSLSDMYLQILDADVATADLIDRTLTAGDNDAMGCIGTSLSGKTYGSVSTAGNQWVKVTLDLSKMNVGTNFDKKRVQHLRFGYDYSRNIYLQGFTFEPAAKASNPTGFITQQYDVPSYGSATSGVLENAAGAVYTSTLNARASYVVDQSGNFALQNGEIVNFHDQFRRGSYICLEEVLTEQEKALYDTSWTMYENDNAVTSFGTGDTVTNPSTIPDMTDVKSEVVTDGRVEKVANGTVDGHPQLNKYTTARNPGAFLFRSYANPDSTATTTKLKVVYTNKVNTADLTICKIDKNANTNSALASTDTFTFVIEFYNVGGLGLENGKITTVVSLNAGGQTTITGIPVNTQYTIYELKTDSDIVLDRVTGSHTTFTPTTYSGTAGGTTYTNQDAYSVSGSIGTGNKSVEFTNVKKPTISVKATKTWLDTEGNTLQDPPNTIYLCLLQRKAGDGDNAWKPYESASGYKGYQNVTFTPGYGAWEYTFTPLDVYVNYPGNQTKWEYKVVELDANGNVIAENGTITIGGNDYTVTYDPDFVSGNVNANGTVTNSVETQTITNKLKSNISITVTKEWKDGKGNALTANLPESITVRLQRTTDTGESKTWKDVMVNVNGEEVDITLPQNNSWSYTYTELPAKSTDGKVYTYRVVELDSGAETPVVVETGSRITYGTNDYTVTYGNIENAKDSEDKAIDGKYTQTITNTLVPKVKLDITKLSAMDNSPLNGVTFKLEKQSGSGQTEEVGSGTTADGGKLTFTDLEPGTYQLTETKTADGYSLLKAPISIVITPNDDGSYSASVDNSNVTMTEENGHYTLATTIYNKQNLTMPATGGVNGFEFWILGGLCMMAVPLLLYTFFWFKKGGKYLQK